MFKAALIAGFATLSLCGGWCKNSDNQIYGNWNKLGGRSNRIAGD